MKREGREETREGEDKEKIKVFCHFNDKKTTSLRGERRGAD